MQPQQYDEDLHSNPFFAALRQPARRNILTAIRNAHGHAYVLVPRVGSVRAEKLTDAEFFSHVLLRYEEKEASVLGGTHQHQFLLANDIATATISRGRIYVHLLRDKQRKFRKDKRRKKPEGLFTEVPTDDEFLVPVLASKSSHAGYQQHPLPPQQTATTTTTTTAATLATTQSPSNHASSSGYDNLLGMSPPVFGNDAAKFPLVRAPVVPDSEQGEAGDGNDAYVDVSDVVSAKILFEESFYVEVDASQAKPYTVLCVDTPIAGEVLSVVSESFDLSTHEQIMDFYNDIIGKRTHSRVSERIDILRTQLQKIDYSVLTWQDIVALLRECHARICTFVHKDAVIKRKVKSLLIKQNDIALIAETVLLNGLNDEVMAVASTMFLAQDSLLNRKSRRLNGINLAHFHLKEKLKPIIPDVAKLLLKIPRGKSRIAKLGLWKQVITYVFERSLEHNVVVSADELIPILCSGLVSCIVRRWHAVFSVIMDLHFTEADDGETTYFLAMLEGTLAHIMHIDERDIALRKWEPPSPSDEYLRPLFEAIFTDDLASVKRFISAQTRPPGPEPEPASANRRPQHLASNNSTTMKGNNKRHGKGEGKEPEEGEEEKRVEEGAVVSRPSEAQLSTSPPLVAHCMCPADSDDPLSADEATSSNSGMDQRRGEDDQNGIATTIIDDDPLGVCDPLCACEKCKPTTIDGILLADTAGTSSVHYAAKCGRTKILGFLLEKICAIAPETAPDFSDANLRTPLHLACAFDEQACVFLLLDHHASVHYTDRHGYNALHFCAEKSFYRCMKTLLFLKPHPRINARTNKGNTALHIASYFSFIDIVTLLIKSGADTRLLNNNKQTPFALASNSVVIEALEGRVNRSRITTPRPSQSDEDDGAAEEGGREEDPTHGSLGGNGFRTRSVANHVFGRGDEKDITTNDADDDNEGEGEDEDDASSTASGTITAPSSALFHNYDHTRVEGKETMTGLDGRTSASTTRNNNNNDNNNDNNSNNSNDNDNNNNSHINNSGEVSGVVVLRSPPKAPVGTRRSPTFNGGRGVESAFVRTSKLFDELTLDEEDEEDEEEEGGELEDGKETSERASQSSTSTRDTKNEVGDAVEQCGGRDDDDDDADLDDAEEEEEDEDDDVGRPLKSQTMEYFDAQDSFDTLALVKGAASHTASHLLVRSGSHQHHQEDTDDEASAFHTPDVYHSDNDGDDDTGSRKPDHGGARDHIVSSSQTHAKSNDGGPSDMAPTKGPKVSAAALAKALEQEQQQQQQQQQQMKDVDAGEINGEEGKGKVCDESTRALDKHAIFETVSGSQSPRLDSTDILLTPKATSPPPPQQRAKGTGPVAIECASSTGVKQGVTGSRGQAIDRGMVAADVSTPTPSCEEAIDKNERDGVSEMGEDEMQRPRKQSIIKELFGDDDDDDDDDEGEGEGENEEDGQ